MKRGEVWWASLPPAHGSGPGYRRPVLVVQSDAFNASRIQTVVVAVITSNLRLAKAPGNFLLRRRVRGLPKDSVLNVSQLITIDRSFLTEKAAELSARRMTVVEDGIRLVLSL